MSDLSPNDFMVAFWRAQLMDDEAQLKRLKALRFGTPEMISALEKWVGEGKRILAQMETL